MRLCSVASEAFHRKRDLILPLVEGMTYKRLDQTLIEGLPSCLETGLNIGSPGFIEELEETGAAAALCTGRYEAFSCDIGPACPYTIGQSANGYPRALPVGPLLSSERYLNHARENASRLRDFFEGEVRLENLNYFPTGAYELVCDPGFIAEVIETTGAGLVVDLAHSAITAYNMGQKPGEYLSTLPLGRVTEAHLSHPLCIAGTWEDAHEPPGPDEIAMLGLILDSRPQTWVTVEHYRDDEALAVAYRELREIAAGRSVTRLR